MIKVIAEVGSNWWHPDSEQAYELALRSIREAKDAGAAIVKFQVFKVQSLYAEHRNSVSDIRLTGIRQRLLPFEIPLGWFPDLRAEADRVGVELWASVFNPNMVNDIACRLHGLKLASGDINNWPLIRSMERAAAQYGIPLAISTGAANWYEIRDIINSVLGFKIPVILMHCVSAYPAKEEDLNLSTIRELVQEFPFVSHGFSDHSLGSLGAQIAVSLGATYIEKHFQPGGAQVESPDYGHALGRDVFRDYVQAINKAEMMLGKGKKHDFSITDAEANERLWARRGPDGLRPNL